MISTSDILDTLRYELETVPSLYYINNNIIGDGGISFSYLSNNFKIEDKIINYSVKGQFVRNYKFSKNAIVLHLRVSVSNSQYGKYDGCYYDCFYEAVTTYSYAISDISYLHTDLYCGLLDHIRIYNNEDFNESYEYKDGKITFQMQDRQTDVSPVF